MSTSLETRAATLLRMTEVTREEILRFYHVDSCVASTRALIEVLRYFGHASKPVPVSVQVFNRAGREHADKGMPVEEWPEGAWSIGVTGTGEVTPERWDGHLVAMTDDEKIMMDPSLDQVSRPAKGIVMHPSLFGFVEPWPPDNFISFDREDGVLLVYRRLPRPGPWWTAPDWQGHHALIRKIVGASIRRLHQEL